MAKRGPKPMPEEDWVKIKRFQKNGCSRAFAADMTGWSNKVVGRTYESNTYQEYLNSASGNTSKTKDIKKQTDESQTEENELNDLINHLQNALNIAIKLKVRRSPEKDDDEYLKSIYEAFGSDNVEEVS